MRAAFYVKTKYTIMESTQRINTVFRPAEAVTYNPNRVIFDQTMRAAYGGVNILALKAGQNLVKHTAPRRRYHLYARGRGPLHHRRRA